MEVSPPKARGSGRSGPRRRTGCLTCRARKVRCDEAKPDCANCVRLRLQCSYKNIVPGLVTRRNGQAQKPVRTAVSSAPDHPDLNFFNAALRPDERRWRSLQANVTEQDQRALLESPIRTTHHHTPEFQGTFDMLGFIGEITSDLEQKHLDLTNGLSELPLAGDILSPLQTESRPVEDLSTVDSGYSNAVQNDFPVDVGMWPEAKATYQDELFQYFLNSEAPPTIFGSVSLEWSYVRRVIAILSRECSFLLTSIYCYSDILKAMKEGKRWRMAPAFHRQASSEIQSHFQDKITLSTLERVFTAVFLLMMAELMCSPEQWDSETSYLHSAYILLQQFHHRTETWSGFGNLIVSWVSLLDVKALIAGREGDPLVELGNLSKSTTDKYEPSPSKGHEEVNSVLSHPAYLIQTAITTPAFHFFTQTQQIIRRIISIDLHHRSRGTVSDEFDVLQIAHQVNADLESLWNTRPSILDVYNRPDTHLFDFLQPVIASQICRVFRQYVANFLAIFIYLHRVAFVIYPRTDRVHRAVDQIIQLATLEASSASSLPTSFLWPLFVAGLEGSHEQRAWIVEAMQRMAGLDSRRKGSYDEDQCSQEQSHDDQDSNSTEVDDSGASVLRHPNAAKALLLLEEMTRRQDTSRTWADSRCVRREMFTNFFVMI